MYGLIDFNPLSCQRKKLRPKEIMKLKSLAQGGLTVSGKASAAGRPGWRFSTDLVAKFIYPRNVAVKKLELK